MASKNLDITSYSDTQISEVESAAPLLAPACEEAVKFYERPFDILLSIAILIFLAPIFLTVMLVVLLGSGRPIFYSQTRIGRGGRAFQILKFRTMVPKAHLLKSQIAHLNFMSGPFFKVKDDPRLTPVGKFLRKWSLDELPQILNVIRGDMSLVGPRPMLPEEISQLHCDDILAVNPGITGLWQVSGRNEIVDFRKKLGLDRIYVKRKGLFFDLWILMLTFRAVFRISSAH